MRKPTSSTLPIVTHSLCALQCKEGIFPPIPPTGRWKSARLTAYKRIVWRCWEVGHFMVTLCWDRWAVCYCHSLEFKKPSCLLWISKRNEGARAQGGRAMMRMEGTCEVDINTVVWGSAVLKVFILSEMKTVHLHPLMKRPGKKIIHPRMYKTDWGCWSRCEEERRGETENSVKPNHFDDMGSERRHTEREAN